MYLSNYARIIILNKTNLVPSIPDISLELYSPLPELNLYDSIIECNFEGKNSISKEKIKENSRSLSSPINIVVEQLINFGTGRRFVRCCEVREANRVNCIANYVAHMENRFKTDRSRFHPQVETPSIRHILFTFLFIFAGIEEGKCQRWERWWKVKGDLRVFEDDFFFRLKKKKKRWSR